jgi:hypothetical protein
MDCKHPWDKLTTVEDDRVQCMTCCEILTPAEIHRAKIIELNRLSADLVQAQQTLLYGDAEFDGHYKPYRAAFDAYRQFRLTYMTDRSEPLTLPI